MNIIRYSVFVNSQERIIFGNQVKITIQGGNSETLQVGFFFQKPQDIHLMTMMGRDLENDVEMPEKMEVEVGILNLEIERVAKKLISVFLAH